MPPADRPRSKKPLRLLLVEDNTSDALLLLDALREGGFDPYVERVDSASAMEAALAGASWDIVLADYSLPNFSALEALRVMRAAGLDLPFIMVSGTIGEELAVEAMKAGAHDYIMKDNLHRLVPAIQREIREATERAARKRAEDALAHQALHDSLTDLPNRNLFNDRLQQAIRSARRN